MIFRMRRTLKIRKNLASELSDALGVSCATHVWKQQSMHCKRSLRTSILYSVYCDIYETSVLLKMLVNLNYTTKSNMKPARIVSLTIYTLLCLLTDSKPPLASTDMHCSQSNWHRKALCGLGMECCENSMRCITV
jgi:hypothetical protein